MGAFKLGKMTFGSLFKKPETIMYPIVSKPQPPGLKGHIVVDANQCILCGMCERNCPTDCISVDKKERYWQNNPYNCIQCGYCVTVCPKKCLHMDPNYWAASVAKEPQRVTVPLQEESQPKAKASAEQSAETQPLPKPAPATQASEQANTSATSTSQQASEQAAAPVVPHDAQLETLLSQLDDEKAKIVESALAGR